MTLEDHKKLGISYFNKTWDYLNKKNRNNEDDLKMIHYVHASRFHWQMSGAPILNIVRGDWQVSRVYSVLKMGESALIHAKACYKQTIENNIGDFDLVFAYESMAHAYQILHDLDNMNKYLELGYNAIDQVEKDEDKEYCKSELDNIKK
ncbi:hypothetical protein KQ51_01675 [Candidatus Izimaplasma bacterium HR1]|jgi:hypothetical protein|uniref:hypothetical protein n=1 Tax=Candidatus Izimoplasma sp. HR1 TaxID=1541959 RepID=UPI0004F5BFD0|nr:hypothetical protein KQ51_01675 [Candidatus Izimaplasma bacterium HR1]